MASSTPLELLFTHVQALTFPPGDHCDDHTFPLGEALEEDMRNASTHLKRFGMMKIESENKLDIVLFSKCAKPGQEIDAGLRRIAIRLFSEAMSAPEIFIDQEVSIIPDDYYSLMVLDFQSGSCSGDSKNQLMTRARAFSDHISSVSSDLVSPKSFEICWFYGTVSFNDHDKEAHGILILSSWTDQNSINHFKNGSSEWNDFLQGLRKTKIFTEKEYNGIMVSVPDSAKANSDAQGVSDKVNVEEEEKGEDRNGDDDDFEEQLGRLSEDVKKMRSVAEEIAKEMANSGPCDGCILYDVALLETRAEAEDAGKLTGIRKMIRKIV